MIITLDTGQPHRHSELLGLRALIDSLLGTTAVTVTAPVAVDNSDQDDALVEASLTATDTPTDATTDNTGLPWDARIHAESKALTANGTWRKRRGVDEALVESVTAELRAAQTDAPAPVADVPNVPAPPAPAVETPPAPPPPVVPPAPTAPAPTASPTADATTADDGSFPSYAKFVQAVSGKGLSYQSLNEKAADLGVESFKALKDHPGMWTMFFETLA